MIRWIPPPSAYGMVGLVGALSGSKFSGTVVGCPTFSVQKQTGHPARSLIDGTWKGSYLGCVQGTTALTLIVKSAGQTGNQLAAKFEFHALPSNPGVASGSFTMKGYLFPGVVVLYASKWVKQPSGYLLVDLAGPLPKAGGFGAPFVLLHILPQENLRHRQGSRGVMGAPGQRGRSRRRGVP